MSPFTLQQQAFEWPGAMWVGEIALPPVVRSFGGAILEAFVASLHGRSGTFLLGPRHAKRILGTSAGSGVTVNGAGQTGAALAVAGVGAGATILAGTFLQVTDGTTARLHMVVENATADGSGLATLTIEPELRSSPAASSAVVFDEPVGTMRLTTDELGFSVGPAGAYSSLALGFMEAL